MRRETLDRDRLVGGNEITRDEAAGAETVGGDMHGTRTTNGFDVPDIAGVLIDGTIRAKLSRAGGVVDRQTEPLGAILEGVIDLVLGLDVGREIVTDEVKVVCRGDALKQRLPLIRLTKETRFNHRNDLIETWIEGKKSLSQIVADRRDVGCESSKDKDVFFFDLLEDFDVCAVESSENHSSVHHELHVARS